MTRIPRLAPTGAVVLLPLVLGACGGAPTDASVTEFCAVAVDRSWAAELGTDASGEDIVDGLQGWGDDLEQVGTPEGIPDAARSGFEVTVDYLGDLDPDDFEDLADAAPGTGDLSDEENDDLAAYNTYVAETCRPDPGIEVPEPSAS